MSFASQDPTHRHLERKVIELLLDFRQKVGPLNQIHNDCIQQFTKIIMGLLVGSDGGTAFQGPGANALAELVGQFLDGERRLAGTDPLALEGRLQDAAVICERHAHNLQNTLATAHRKASLFAGLLDSGVGPDGKRVIPMRLQLANCTNIKLICRGQSTSHYRTFLISIRCQPTRQ